VVTGTPPVGPDVTDNDTADVNVIAPTNPLIGTAKRVVGTPVEASAGTWDVTYEIYVENYGNVALTALQVADDLDATFPLPTTFIVQSLSSTDFTVNWPGYNGSSNINLLTGTDTLNVGASGTITLVVRVIPAEIGPFNNTAVASGQPPSGLPVQDDSQDGTNPDNTPTGFPGYNGDGDPTNNDQPTPVSFGPILFDPPFGVKFVDDNGLPVLRWTMVWINASNLVAVNAAVSDGIPLGTTYAGGLSCTGEGVTTTTSCAFEAPSGSYPRGRIVWTGSLGPDFGATDAASASNELYIRFNVTVNTGITSVDNQATMDSDLNGDGDLTDPGEQIVATSAASWQVSVLLPDTGFTPGRMTRLEPQPEDKRYTAQEDFWLEIPSQKVKMDIVGVPKVEGEWDVSWLWRDAGYLEGSAFPTYSGNSVITGHVYLPNGLPGPFVDISKLKYGDRITVHAYDQTFIYEVRKVEYLKPTDVSKAFEHKEESWVTLLTCRSYDEKTDTYRQRIAVKAVLIKVIR
jgi:LPXTG-site transpeptidase (sortase) family protein